MLKVHTKKWNAVEVLCLEGQIVNGDTSVMRNAVRLADDTSAVILDLSNVTTVDAHGLGVLLQMREQTLAKGIHFKLMNVSKPLYGIFEITRLNTVFEINSRVECLPEVTYSRPMLVAAA
jgi:anti-anti-sigma factor